VPRPVSFPANSVPSSSEAFEIPRSSGFISASRPRAAAGKTGTVHGPHAKQRPVMSCAFEHIRAVRRARVRRDPWVGAPFLYAACAWLAGWMVRSPGRANGASGIARDFRARMSIATTRVNSHKARLLPTHTPTGRSSQTGRRLETMLTMRPGRPTVFSAARHQRRRRGQQRERRRKVVAITCSSSRDWL